MTDQETPEEPVPGLSDLPREAVPPPSLENRVVALLAERGLLARTAPRRRRTQRALAAVAAVALLVGGWVLGRWQPHAASPAFPVEPRFALLLYEPAGYRPPPPSELLRVVGEYNAWARAQRGVVQIEGGERLEAEGRLLEAAADTVTDAEYRPGAGGGGGGGGGALRGFFVVRAPSLAEAARAARSCPHLRYGGYIVVRPIGET